MDPLRREPSAEIARLRAKLNEIDDPVVRGVIVEKIASLEATLPDAVDGGEKGDGTEPGEPNIPQSSQSSIVHRQSESIPTLTPPDPAEAARIREKLTELQRRADRVEDEDVREELNREAIRLHFLLVGRPLPTDEQTPAASGVQTDPALVAKAENLIREARVERMRSNHPKADALMQEAAAIAPNSVEVLSALGDECTERKQWGKARDFYRQALILKPKDPVLERKLGDLVLRLGPARSVEDQLRGLSDSPFLTSEDATANARIATGLSLFCPGLGQIVLGRTWQGIATFTVWALMIFWIFLRKDDLRDLLSVVGIGRPHGSGGMIILLPILIALAIHFGAVAACSGAAKKATKRTIDRPVPPMNLPFE